MTKGGRTVAWLYLEPGPQSVLVRHGVYWIHDPGITNGRLT